MSVDFAAICVRVAAYRRFGVSFKFFFTKVGFVVVELFRTEQATHVLCITNLSVIVRPVVAAPVVVAPLVAAPVVAVVAAPVVVAPVCSVVSVPVVDALTAVTYWVPRRVCN
jgi:hypothetical protein